MFKIVLCFSMVLACGLAAPSPNAFLAAPVVTATSSQVVVRNHNAALVAPAVVAAAPVVRAAPLVAAAPALAAPLVAAPAYASAYAPAYSPYTNLAYSGYPYLI